MPNWCYNYVTCTGGTEDIAKLKKTLSEGLEHISTYKEATSLGVENIEDGYFFDIVINEEKETWVQFSYETKWAPNLLDLAEVCKAHNVEAECEYNECGMQICGKAIIDSEGSIHDDQIPSDFLDLIEYNEETGLYEYNGEEYETEGDIIEEYYGSWKLANASN